MVKDLLAKTQPSVGEFVFMLGVTITFILFITFIDMMVHDGYVRPIIAECYESNSIAFCEERRFELLSESPITVYLGNTLLSEQDDQLQLGGHYWLALLTIVIFISAIMGIGRIVKELDTILENISENEKTTTKRNHYLFVFTNNFGQ